MTQLRTESSPAAMYGRIPVPPASRIPDPGTEALLDDLIIAWEELERLEGARDGALARGRLEGGPSLSTGTTNALAAFVGRGLIPANWRQARGTLDPTGDNNGLVWEEVRPGDSGDLLGMARTITYGSALTLTLTPVTRAGIVTVSFVAGVARSLVVAPLTYSAIVTYIAGTTTYAQIAADWNASAAALALATITGDAGTVPAMWEGGVLHLSQAILVEHVQGVSTAVDWNATTRTVTVALDIAGVGDSVANILAALAASASAAQYAVQARNLYTSSGAGNVTTGGFTQLLGGAGKAMRRAYLLMAQAAHKDLIFEHREFGADARPVYVALINDALVEPPTVSVTDWGGAGVRIDVTAKTATATALHIRQALRDSVAAMRWITVRLAPGSNGSGTPTAFAATILSAGADAEALDVSAGTVAATGVAALTDDGFTVDIPALGAVHPAASIVTVRARICGVMHELPVHVVT